MAARGFKVFPLVEKKGKLIPTRKNPFAFSTSDLFDIEMTEAVAWGIDCGGSGLVVVDLDEKNGKKGMTDWLDLTRDRPVDRTLTVKTPSGGLHIYLQGATRNLIGGLAAGIDIKSVGGYVVCPGSAKQGGSYQIEVDAPVTPAPAWLVERIGEPAKKDPNSKTPVCKLDSDEQKADAERYLAEIADPAIEDQHGNNTAFKAACRAKDLGVSAEVCEQLMAAVYNPRCLPPWSCQELHTIVTSAYNYGQNPPGCESSQAIFSNPPGGIEYHLVSEIDVGDLPPRKWILKGRSVAKYLTAIISPGGLGKTSLSYLEALAIATNGRINCGAEVVRGGNVWMHSAEDPISEVKMRFVALGLFYKQRRDKLEHQIFMTSSREIPFSFADLVGNKVAKNRDKIAQAVALIRQHNIVAWYLDPFAQTHTLNENDNSQMAQLAGILQSVLEETECSITIVHHTKKASGAGMDMDSARGASAIANACRVMYGLRPMTEAEGAEFALTPLQAKNFAKLESYKTSLTAPIEYGDWYGKHSVLLPNGEEVGVVRLEDPEAMNAAGENPKLALAKFLSPLVGEDDPLSLDAAKKFAHTMPGSPVRGQAPRDCANAILAAFAKQIDLDSGSYVVSAIDGKPCIVKI